MVGRTRNQEALFFKEMHEKNQKKKKMAEEGISSDSDDDVVRVLDHDDSSDSSCFDVDDDSEEDDVLEVKGRESNSHSAAAAESSDDDDSVMVLDDDDDSSTNSSCFDVDDDSEEEEDEVVEVKGKKSDSHCCGKSGLKRRFDFDGEREEMRKRNTVAGRLRSSSMQGSKLVKEENVVPDYKDDTTEAEEEDDSEEEDDLVEVKGRSSCLKKKVDSRSDLNEERKEKMKGRSGLANLRGSSKQRKNLEKGENATIHDDDDDEIVELGEDDDEDEEEEQESDDDDCIYKIDESEDDEDDSETDEKSDGIEEEDTEDGEEEEEGKEEEGGGRKKKAHSEEDVKRRLFELPHDEGSGLRGCSSERPFEGLKKKCLEKGKYVVIVLDDDDDSSDQEDNREGFNSDDIEENDDDHGCMDSDGDEVGRNSKKSLDVRLKKRCHSDEGYCSRKRHCSRFACGRGGGGDKDAYERSEVRGITKDPVLRRGSSSKSGFAGGKKRARDEVERQKKGCLGKHRKTHLGSPSDGSSGSLKGVRSDYRFDGKRIKKSNRDKTLKKRGFEKGKNFINVDSDDEYIDQHTKKEKLFPYKGKGGIAGSARSKKVEMNSRASMKGEPVLAENIFNLFVNTIWKKSGDHENTESVLPTNYTEPLLRKFNYGIEKHEPVEKSDEEKYLDTMWEEFDFSLASCDGGSFVASMPAVETEGADEPTVEMDQASRCSQGKHDFILDDQVGIKCRYCPYVHLEIKYVMPPVDTYCYGRSTKKSYTHEDNSLLWETLRGHDAGGDSQDLFANGKGSVWDIFTGIRERMYPHQEEGFEFLWKNIAGGTELNNLNNNDIGGCIISHAPGTGKSFLTIAFLRSYMEVFKDCRPVIMAPHNMLPTWDEELKKWGIDFPFHNLSNKELSGREEEWACNMIKSTTRRTNWIRMIKLLSWSKNMSILGISYSLFEKLAGQRSAKGNVKGGNIKSAKEAEEMKRILLEKPSLLVLDEGHTPRNKDSCIWKALENVKTRRRIILSGTPFQNNFEELYNTLYLVRPKFAERLVSETPYICQSTPSSRGKGEWDSLTRSIGKHENEQILDKIRALINPFVHSYKGSILKENLPGLRGCVMVLNPLPLQRDLLERVNEEECNYTRERAVSVVSFHPSLLTCCKCSEHEKYSTYASAAKDSQLDLDQGVKARFLIEFIRLCEVLKEKVLVFSQFIDPFYLIKDQLKRVFRWTEGHEVLQISGVVKDRQPIINAFNDPCSKARVLLASIKTSGEGINLIGASRVIFLDTAWNPSVERQAISRAYRLGQKKVVYTYHLLTSGTLEEDKYDRQVKKDQLGELVFLSSQSDGANAKDQPAIWNDRVLEAMVQSNKFRDSFKEIRVLTERVMDPFESVPRQSSN